MEDIKEVVDAAMAEIKEKSDAIKEGWKDGEPSDKPKADYQKKTFVPTAEGREKVMNEVLDKLQTGIADVFNSENYKNWLATCSKFRTYSVSNTILIAMQGKDIPGFTGQIAGYNSWKNNFHRQVMKGQKGIKILAPAPYKKKEEREVVDPVTHQPIKGADGQVRKETVEITIPAFKPVTVFDACQTDGEPLPQLGVDELKFSVENYQDYLAALQKVSPVPVEFADIEGGAKGYFSPKDQKIVIQQGMSEAQTIKTLVHEISHSLLHDKDNVRVEGIEESDKKSRSTKELEAESCAYVVLQSLGDGIDTSEYSFSYIAGWSQDKEMKDLKESLDTIKKTSSMIIGKLEDELKAIQQERENVQETDKAKDLSQSKQEEKEPVVAQQIVADKPIKLTMESVTKPQDDRLLADAAPVAAKAAAVSTVSKTAVNNTKQRTSIKAKLAEKQKEVAATPAKPKTKQKTKNHGKEL